MRCAECESFTDIRFDQTDLYLWLPLSHTHTKVHSLLSFSIYEFDLLVDDVIKMSLPGDDLAKFMIKLEGELTPQELAGTKALTMPTGKQPDVSTLSRVMPLEQMVGLASGAWLRELIEEDRFTSFFQPIVNVASGEIFGYEALFRGKERDDKLLSPGHIFKTAERSGILFNVDLAARRSAVERASELGLGDARLFINFNPSAIYDPAYCLRTTVSACEELGIKPSSIVFEVVETSAVDDVEHLKGILKFYRRAGFKVALDDVGAGYSSLNLLEELRPDLMKIDRHLIIDIDAQPFKQSVVSHLISLAHAEDIKVVVEGVETDAECQVLTDMKADYIQGYHIARPRPKLLSNEEIAGLKTAA